MGSFEGHLVPGLFFLVMGIWQTYKLLEKYYLIRRAAMLSRGRKEHVVFRSSISHGLVCSKTIPIEEFIVVAMSCLGILGELIEI